MKTRRKWWLGPLWFFLVWAIIWGVPRLRSLAVYQIASDDEVAQAALWLAPLSRFWPQQSRADSGQAFVARYPDDARVQAWGLNNGGGIVGDAESWKPLIQRFPDQAWLRSGCIIRLLNKYQSGRVPGTLLTIPGTPVPPERPSNFSIPQLNQAISLCREGATLEPQNCFWDLMQAHFLFGARRDDEALRVLQSGSRKMYYDDHLWEETRKMLEVENLRRSLILEEKIAQSQSVVFSHTTHLRNITRLVTWKAMQKQARGDWKSGLQLRADMARLSYLVSEQSGYVLTTLTGLACMGITWRAGASGPKNLTLNRAARQKFWMNHFIQKCRAHGRPDLAKETLRNGQRAMQIAEETQRVVTLYPYYSGVPESLYVKILGLNWLGATLLMQLLITLPCWLFLSGLLWWKRVTGEERSLGAVFLIWLALVLLCGAVTAIGFFYGGANNLLFPNTLLVPDDLISLLRWFIALSPLFLGALFCGVLGAWRKCKLWRDLDSSQMLDENFFMRPVLRRIVWLLLILLIATCLGIALRNGGFISLFSPLGTLDWFLEFFQSSWFALNLLFFALAWWIFSGVWLAPQKARPLTGENLKWYRQSLGMALVGGSMLYLSLLMVSLQVRRPAEVAFDTLMQRGEMAVLRSIK